MMRVNRPSQETELRSRLARVRVLAMDVDGVLTDGGLTLGGDGGEWKRFHVADGLGLVALRLSGIQTVWISGRSSAAVERRAGELKVSRLVQGARDKASTLHAIVVELSVAPADVVYIGDDWNDLPAFEVAGIRIAVANAAAEVCAAADFITTAPGGQGAVREVCEALMEARGERQQCLESYLMGLRLGSSDGSARQ